MPDSALLAVLLAGVAGFLASRALQSARRRDAGTSGAFRSSIRFANALQALAAGQLELARSELEKVAREEPPAFEVKLLLGHLFREAGQVERALQEHRALLSESLSRAQRAAALVGLGRDQRAAGFLDRATRTFEEVLDADPKSLQALDGLARLHEDQRQWHRAYETRLRLQRLRRSDDGLVLGHLQAEIGREALATGRVEEAERAFRTALRLNPRVFPAYLGLAALQGRLQPSLAATTLTEAAAVAPERAYLVFDALAEAWAAAGEAERFVGFCEEIIRRDPRDWRGRLALGRQLRALGKNDEALGLLLRATAENPHALLVHLETWHVLRALGISDSHVDAYGVALEAAAFYCDPHVCTRCRYRADDMLWRCPHCHEWNSFLEERVGPAAEPQG